MREVLALDDISRGRFLLGIGSGGDLDARIMGEDLPLKARVDRFHEFTELLDRLLRDDHVSAEGRFYTARDVRDPPRAGARHGRRQPGAPRHRGQRTPLDPARRRARRRLDDLRRHRRHRRRVVGPHRRPSSRVDDALEAAGRAPESLTRYLNLDSAPTFSLTSAAAFEDAVGRAAALGFTDVITHWPRDDEPFRARATCSSRSRAT